MSSDLSLASLGPICSIDLAKLRSGTEAQRIHQVSLAMESIFAGQLTQEMGKATETLSGSKEPDPYSDFIQQAMTQSFTSGKGLGLAKTIEHYLTRHDSAQAAVTTTTTTSVHGHRNP